MRIQDCELNAGKFVMAPFVRHEAEDSWLSAKNNGHIPESLFDLYRAAGYLSFDASPNFLSDPDHILFSYFSMTMASLRASLVDAFEFESEITRTDFENYFPGKHLTDRTWTRERSEKIARQSNLAFRNLLISLLASLDTVAELIAIFAQGGIRRLRVGHAQFTRIAKWLDCTYELNLIATPRDSYLADIHRALQPIIFSPAPETDWLPYLTLLRNKSAHLGHGTFRWMGLQGRDGMHYTFIPREWPFLWEKHMKESGQPPSVPIAELLLGMLTHQDVIDFVRGARRKVMLVISEAVRSTMKAYVDFMNFEFNQTALSELTANSESFQFTHFAD